MQSLLDMDFALDNRIPYQQGSIMMIGLANGSVEVLVGETYRGLPNYGLSYHLHQWGVFSTLRSQLAQMRIQATSEYITGEYSMETPSLWVFIRNTPLGCKVLCTEWRIDQEERPLVKYIGDNVPHQFRDQLQ